MLAFRVKVVRFAEDAVWFWSFHKGFLLAANKRLVSVSKSCAAESWSQVSVSPLIYKGVRPETNLDLLRRSTAL
jgi:hypothetical protein